VSPIKSIAFLILLLTVQTKVFAQKLNFLIPNGAIVQHAGSIGYLSGGVSYDLFKNKRGSFDVMYGFVPESKGGSFSTLTTKLAYRPFEIKVNDWMVIYPINPGGFFSYTIQKDLDLTWDKGQYPKGYYYWSEALRAHVSLGTELTFNITKLLKSGKPQALTLFYEVNTNDMYLVNFFQNLQALPVTEIFKAGVGIKASF